MLERPEFNEKNEQLLCEMGGKNKNMLMTVRVKHLLAGGRFSFCNAENETALLLLSGTLEFRWDGECRTASRANPFEKKPYCLHVPKGTAVTAEALSDCEFIVQQTDNDIVFTPVFYTPEDCLYQEFGKGQWDGTGHRVVSTMFDLTNAPYSNMVMGEVYNLSGKWSSYPPHHHPQPEVYYYKFDRPEGFGACFLGDEVHKSTDGSFAAISGGNAHQQVVAPGFTMYYCWMIRHLDNDPWDKTRIYVDGYEWLTKL